RARLISSSTSAHSAKLTKPSIASARKSSTCSSSARDALKAFVGSEKRAASFLKLTQPRPFTRHSASQGANSWCIGLDNEGPPTEAKQSSIIPVSALSNSNAQKCWQLSPTDKYKM